MHHRPAAARGLTRTDWLESAHTFSFGSYHDPRFMGFGPLRVINDDRVAPGAGFAPHSHRDMEILSFVVDGALEHRDSLGNGSVIRPGQIQRMSAGTGITHSEYNPSPGEPVRFLQIWIEPERTGLAPGYEQTDLPPAVGAADVRRIAARQPAPGAVILHRDVEVWLVRLAAGATTSLRLAGRRSGWLQVVDGTLAAGDLDLVTGDGLALPQAAELSLRAATASHALWFDLPEVATR